MSGNDLKRSCPLTNGGPIKMTMAGFQRCCAAKKQEAEEAAQVDENKNNKKSKTGVGFRSPCLSCSGHPAELTIIELPLHEGSDQIKEEKAMPENTTSAKDIKLLCENCGRTGFAKLTTSHGKKCCSTCVNLRTHVKNRAALVLEIIKELAPDTMPTGNEAKQLQDEISSLREKVRQLEAAGRSQGKKEPGVDRSAIQDLALRIAVGMISGERVTTTVEDVELLRAI